MTEENARDNRNPPPEPPQAALNPKLMERLARLGLITLFCCIAVLLALFALPLLAAAQYVFRMLRERAEPRLDSAFEWVTEYLVSICDYLSFKSDALPWPFDEA